MNSHSIESLSTVVSGHSELIQSAGVTLLSELCLRIQADPPRADLSPSTWDKVMRMPSLFWPNNGRCWFHISRESSEYITAVNGADVGPHKRNSLHMASMLNYYPSPFLYFDPTNLKIPNTLGQKSKVRVPTLKLYTRVYIFYINFRFLYSLIMQEIDYSPLH